MVGGILLLRSWLSRRTNGSLTRRNPLVPMNLVTVRRCSRTLRLLDGRGMFIVGCTLLTRLLPMRYIILVINALNGLMLPRSQLGTTLRLRRRRRWLSLLIMGLGTRLVSRSPVRVAVRTLEPRRCTRTSAVYTRYFRTLPSLPRNLMVRRRPLRVRESYPIGKCTASYRFRVLVGLRLV